MTLKLLVAMALATGLFPAASGAPTSAAATYAQISASAAHSGAMTNSSVSIGVLTGTALSTNAPSSVASGAKAKVTGVLSSSDAACASSVEVSLKMGSATAGTATTNATGAYKFSVKIQKKTSVKVTYAGNASCAPSTSASKTIKAT